MKKLFIILCLLICSSLYAKDNCPQVDKNNPIDIYYKGTYIKSMKMADWEAAWQMMDNYNKLKAIEETLVKENKKVGKIVIELEDSIWNITNNRTFTTYAIIKWNDAENKTLKSLRVKIEINRERDPNASWYMVIAYAYSDYIAPTGCLVFGITTILLLLF